MTREGLSGRLIPQLIGTDGAGLAAGGLRTAAEEGAEVAAMNTEMESHKW
ncbi:hypothetical protein ACFOOM_04750 [Streptomyces echinoruber]|uniref:Uncharacterized protein n=1 Tax=Streptomyces echinoruber TaxID=68898 RepID=A0A918VCM5_9ACTN|nr:hypothetical protein [Streptomyces echinoruber]GGZ91206.1 hypothetical protein GCM10010389_32150 [Streptomyces echinoruber]